MESPSFAIMGSPRKLMTAPTIIKVSVVTDRKDFFSFINVFSFL